MYRRKTRKGLFHSSRCRAFTSCCHEKTRDREISTGRIRQNKKDFDLKGKGACWEFCPKNPLPGEFHWFIQVLVLIQETFASPQYSNKLYWLMATVQIGNDFHSTHLDLKDQIEDVKETKSVVIPCNYTFENVPADFEMVVTIYRYLVKLQSSFLYILKYCCWPIAARRQEERNWFQTSGFQIVNVQSEGQ